MYRRRYRRRRRYIPYRRRRFRRKGFGRGANTTRVAWNAYRLARKVKGMMNVEYKYFDNDNSTVGGDNINTTGSMYYLHDIDKGDEPHQRNGDSIKGKSINIKGKLTMHASATNTTVRMIVFHWKDSRGDTPDFDTLYDTDISSGVALDAVNKVWANRNKENIGTIQIIYNKVFKLDSVNHSSLSIKCFKKFDKKVRFVEESATGTNANVTVGSLWMFLISDEATNTPTFRYVSRYTFLDN